MKIYAEELLLEAVERKASDLHLSVGTPPIFRISSKLVPYGEQELKRSDTNEFAKAILSDEEYKELLNCGEVDTSYQIGNGARFRINAYLQKQQVTIAARVIPVDVPSLEDLNLPKVISKLASQPQGLILVTGPTGSGKTTTLAAMLDLINSKFSKHIITLEDPIEYLHRHKKSVVHQREIGSDSKSFATGLRASLRQDPDVILVGEMRDLETISTAITAAETGHLVLATLHTNGAAQTINRIIDVFPANHQAQIRLQLSDLLQGIISQRLLPRADGLGSVVATEILVNEPAVANLIRNNKIEQIANVIQISRAQGMHLMGTSIKELVNSGTVDREIADVFLNVVGEPYAGL